jgi:hypothetical protein
MESPPCGHPGNEKSLHTWHILYFPKPEPPLGYSPVKRWGVCPEDRGDCLSLPDI